MLVRDCSEIEGNNVGVTGPVLGTIVIAFFLLWFFIFSPSRALDSQISLSLDLTTIPMCVIDKTS